MKKIIKKIYIGLPNHLQSLILWVDDKFRINQLSLMPGGLDIIIEYHNESVLGYDKIKSPRNYIKAVLNNYLRLCRSDFESLQIEEKRQLIIENVSRVYTGQYVEEGENYCKVSFTEVWNSKSSNNFPWENLVEDKSLINIPTEYSTIPFIKEYINFWKYDYSKNFTRNEYLLTLPSGMYNIETKNINIPLGSNRFKVMNISEAIFEVESENLNIPQTFKIPYRYGVTPDVDMDVTISTFTNEKEFRNYDGNTIKKKNQKLLFAENG
jgi:hypothetical protein